MANAELVVAFVALVISIIALFIALTQLLADIFATAEGRRKTSPAVMGPFGRLTVRKRRWRELRFEVYYISPHIALRSTDHSRDEETSLLPLASVSGASSQLEKDKRLQYGVFYELGADPIAEYIEGPGQRNEGWQVLLALLNSRARSYVATARVVSGQLVEMPGVALQEWAWDLLPDDTGKAIASTKLFDILVIARRLGAGWKSCKLRADGLQAEGGGHVFFSTNLRGLGTAIAYQKVGTAKEAIKHKSGLTPTDPASQRTLRSWTMEADKFMFGICPGNPDFDLPDFVIGDIEGLIKVWNHHDYLEIPWQYAKDTGREVRWADLFRKKDGDQLRHATNDLIALACPMLRPPSRGATIHQVLLPFSESFENMFQGFNDDHKGREIFLKRLEQELRTMPENRKSHLQMVLQITSGLVIKEFKNDKEANFLDLAGSGYEITTKYFKAIDNPIMFYWHLMRAHLSRSPVVHGEAVTNFRKQEDREKKTIRLGRRRIRCEQVHLLFDNIDHFQNFMKNEGFEDTDLVREAWITLFFSTLR